MTGDRVTGGADLQAIRITHDTWREVVGSVLSAVRTALKPSPT